MEAGREVTRGQTWALGGGGSYQDRRREVDAGRDSWQGGGEREEVWGGAM